MLIQQLPKLSGIYLIINIQNSKSYVGSSQNINQRLSQHKYNLKHNKHNNPYLQYSWNKYGEEMFVVSVLELCEKSQLLYVEQKWVNKLQPKYNLTVEVIRNTPSPQSIVKITETLKQKYQSGELKSSTTKVIHQYNFQGEYLKSYESIEQAAKEVGCHRCTIDRALNGKKDKDIRTGKGFQWAFELESNIGAIITYTSGQRQHKPKKGKPIYLTDGGITTKFETRKKLAKHFGVTWTCLTHYVDKTLYKKQFKITNAPV